MEWLLVGSPDRDATGFFPKIILGLGENRSFTLLASSGLKGVGFVTSTATMMRFEFERLDASEIFSPLVELFEAQSYRGAF